MLDILALIEEKTRGNFTPEERHLLAQVFLEPRLRLVEAKSTSSETAEAEAESRIIVP